MIFTMKAKASQHARFPPDSIATMSVGASSGLDEQTGEPNG
jgi:hypothetical protein